MKPDCVYEKDGYLCYEINNIPGTTEAESMVAIMKLF